MITAVFIPVRIGSTRLPRKALMEIKGKTLIEHLIDRVKAAKHPDFVVLNTTTEAENDVIEDIAKTSGVRCFRGSVHDIIDRHYQAAKAFGVDFIVNVDGDDVLCDPELIDIIIEAYKKTGDDFIMFKDLPLGATPLGIKFEALKKVRDSKAESNTETGWARYFRESGQFKVKYIEPEEEMRHPEIRMTLDYEEDFQFIKEIYGQLYKNGKIISLKEIMRFLKDNPHIVSINSNADGKYWEYFRKHSRLNLKSDMMKFLIVGLGSMGKRRIRNIQHMKAGDVTGFDISDARRKEAEEKYGIKTTSDISAIDHADAVIISTPPDRHGEYALLAAKSGKHFFVEASVMPEKEIMEANDIAKKKGVVAMPSCTMRFNWRMRKIKELVDSGAIGKVFALQYHMGQWLPDWHPWEDIRSFYAGKRDTGAGREMVPFEMEWLQWIFGDIERIKCMKGKFSQLPVDIDDAYGILVFFKTGILGCLLIDVVSRSPVRRIEVIGDRGTILMDWDENNVKLFNAETKEWSEFTEEERHTEGQYWVKDDMYIDELAHFIDAINKKERLIYTLDDDIKNLRLLLDAEKDSANGK